ncbi:hypothetical protein [Bosea sp. (in: a-proteobacteria)]|uniref:hypothetical protein n=1 Tax=Bosea sp. (in: a-proteobacteria) TaxID=1871050 RepID=UPI002FCA5EAA
MIRFRTIDPAEGASPEAPPAALALQPAVPQTEAAADETAPGKAKGLVRKTALRAKRPEETPLFGK